MGVEAKIEPRVAEAETGAGKTAAKGDGRGGDTEEA